MEKDGNGASYEILSLTLEDENGSELFTLNAAETLDIV